MKIEKIGPKRKILERIKELRIAESLSKEPTCQSESPSSSIQSPSEDRTSLNSLASSLAQSTSPSSSPATLHKETGKLRHHSSITQH
jgi:hypothetical protein